MAEFGRQSGMNAKIVRLTSVYCAGGRLIPSLVEGLLQNKLKQIGSGSNMKHITHVDDCVEGMMLAATKGTPGAIYNIGAKEVPTMGEIMEQVSSAIGRGAPCNSPRGCPARCSRNGGLRPGQRQASATHPLYGRLSCQEPHLRYFPRRQRAGIRSENRLS
ncbi:NAD-dependent epimerase/dehydratase family protein [Geotalea toluenoxydans]|uniref:NAD-dependent epimerase/dehydratase family protein n=1 Tax=Geotalea toluenoxydans TaxID=421624 RepID=UPI000A551CBC